MGALPYTGDHCVGRFDQQQDTPATTVANRRPCPDAERCDHRHYTPALPYTSGRRV